MESLKTHPVVCTIDRVYPYKMGLSVSFFDPRNPDDTFVLDYDMLHKNDWWLKKYIIEECLNHVGENNLKNHLPQLDIMQYHTWKRWRTKSTKDEKLDDKQLANKKFKVKKRLLELLEEMTKFVDVLH